MTQINMHGADFRGMTPIKTLRWSEDIQDTRTKTKSRSPTASANDKQDLLNGFIGSRFATLNATLLVSSSTSTTGSGHQGRWCLLWQNANGNMRR